MSERPQEGGRERALGRLRRNRSQEREMMSIPAVPNRLC